MHKSTTYSPQREVQCCFFLVTVDYDAPSWWVATCLHHILYSTFLQHMHHEPIQTVDSCCSELLMVCSPPERSSLSVILPLHAEGLPILGGNDEKVMRRACGQVDHAAQHSRHLIRHGSPCSKTHALKSARRECDHASFGSHVPDLQNRAWLH